MDRYAATNIAQSPNLRQAIRDAHKENTVLIGSVLGIPSVANAKIMAATSSDLIFLDAEHTPFSPSALADMVHTLKYHSQGKVIPIVRVPSHTHEWVSWGLDAGAGGVIIPHTETVEQVKAAIAAARFPPHGHRSFPPFAVIMGVQDSAPEGKTWLDVANDHCAVIPQIESVKGVENLEEIMQVPGVDAVMIGFVDLGLDMGVEKHAEMALATDRIHSLAKKYNMPLLGWAFTPEQTVEKFKLGYRLLFNSVDVLALLQGVESENKQAREIIRKTKESSQPEATGANGNANGSQENGGRTLRFKNKALDIQHIMAKSTLPVLLPKQYIPQESAVSHLEWKPSRYRSAPQPPPQDDGKLQEIELANARQMLDGKLIKKTRPRRTVDYNGGMGRWALVSGTQLRKSRPNPNYVPYMRPSPPYIIDLLPPKAYPNNYSTSLCTKFVHTSTNKIRCPVNVVVIKFWDPRTGTVLSTLHQHKNTVQALAWSPNGNMVASASRDQTVRVFDIRAMKEYCVLKGHKKEVCSVTWHPVHPILVSGGSEGAVLHWDLSAPETITPTQSTSSPRATLSQAHDSNVWSLAFHPLGHLLVSASNDHTTRFWSRERPGDVGSVFSAGGEKPPEATAQDDDDDLVPGLPGFIQQGFLGSAGQSSVVGTGGRYGGGNGSQGYGGGGDGGGWYGDSTSTDVKGNGSASGGGYDYRRSTNGNGGGVGGYSDVGGSDDLIPGFGASQPQAPGPSQPDSGGVFIGRQADPPPSHQNQYGQPQDEFGRDSRGGGDGDDWGRGGGGNRQGRWAPRRGGGRY
ncbi:hypothetical protein H0H93_016765 [Arthromyces matolae]|nr:hypothetical protein H0H93_016765 [Arthromyces matolae]